MREEIALNELSTSQQYLPDRVYQSIALLFICTGVGLAFYTIGTPYSYWFDEIWSVVVSRRDLASLHQFLLDRDTHSPLYYLLLKAWVALLGDGEVQTRSLSLVFFLATLLPLWFVTKRFGSVFHACAVAFFCSNMLFTYFAHETRMYAMALFFSTLTMATFPFGKNVRPSALFLFGCVMLSLSHYFGFAMAGILLAICLIDARHSVRDTVKIALTGLVALIWPLHHFLHGQVLNKTGGNFWIQVDGVKDSLAIAAGGYIPFPYFITSHALGDLASALALTLPLFILLVYSIVSLVQRYSSERELLSMQLRLSLIGLIFLFSIAAIDLHSPISSSRSYIVLLPVLALLVGSAASLLSKYSAKLALAVLISICLYSSLSAYMSYNRISWKASVVQDWKTATSVLVDNLDGRKVYVGGTADYQTYYLDKLVPESLGYARYDIGTTVIELPAVIMVGQLNNQQHLEFTEQMTLLKGRRVFPNGDIESGFPAKVYLLD